MKYQSDNWMTKKQFMMIPTIFREYGIQLHLQSYHTWKIELSTLKYDIL